MSGNDADSTVINLGAAQFRVGVKLEGKCLILTVLDLNSQQTWERVYREGDAPSLFALVPRLPEIANCALTAFKQQTGFLYRFVDKSVADVSGMLKTSQSQFEF